MSILFILGLLILLTPSKIFAADVVINEYLPNPSGPSSEDTEWIELYNTTTASFDLTGWQLDDQEGGSAPYILPSGTTIAGNSYLTFEKSVTGIILNNTTDEVRLLNAASEAVEVYAYEETDEDSSFGRQSDGSDEWITFTTPSKNASNATGVVPTQTPTPTTEPTRTPTPTKITPTKQPTPTKLPTVTPVKIALTKKVTVSPTVKNADNKDTYPTVVLGARAQRNPSPTASSQQSAKVLGVAKNNIGAGFMSAGGLLLIACAILMFYIRRKHGESTY